MGRYLFRWASALALRLFLKTKRRVGRSKLPKLRLHYPFRLLLGSRTIPNANLVSMEASSRKVVKFQASILDVAARATFNEISASIAILCSIALDFSGLTQIGLPGHLNPELCDTRSSSHSYALSKSNADYISTLTGSPCCCKSLS